ncbi:glycerol-3-phosphate responsive antiterminator [Candidatus Oleimmundimicrobium sp.]|uniref:glycerol-3-phosphate responsive antiterminator n=1 Tax=Candidatus Oleimmundimicrobium sp. TaxID=3060597 RepID=UPI002720AA5E|nr:glycerol-3-phosphate responsive antiterminator [Candidatus Oleimmundimicrobium sp.]MDO8885821.1 glycerol-3-phosphate responsive antiterminator [Candidatus Oleimmundimicrobium sp.]
MQDLRDYFREHPIIASIRNDSDFKYALNSKTAALFILYGDIFNLPLIMKKCKEYNKLVFLHMDLIKGIGRDREGIMYLAKKELCNGIVTTKNNLISIAKKEELIAIQRLFLLDSAALKSGEQLIKNNTPDAVEILPGIAAPYFIEHIYKELLCPVIAGGLISNKSEIEELLRKGVMAVSTSIKELW